MQMSHPSPKKSQWGYAVEDKVYGSDQLKVLPLSHAPASFTGAFGPGQTESTATTTDASGKSTSSKVTTTNYITATYFSTTNEPTPPMVKKGEQIELFTIDDSDKFYWLPYGRDRNIRGLDVKRFEVSALDNTVKGNANVEKTDDNTYFIEFDAVKGQVLISTSKVNKEPVRFRIQIDTKNGKLTMSDDVADGPNQISIDSVNHVITAQNTEGCSLTLNRNDVFFKAIRNLNIDVGEQTILNTPLFVLNPSGELTDHSKSASIVINGKLFALNAANSAVITSPAVGVTGSLKVSGNTALSTVRYESANYGAFGSPYNAVTINIQQRLSSGTTNSPDTNTGSGSRHAAAQEVLTQAAEQIDQAFAKVTSNIGVPGSTDIASTVTSSRMDQLLSK